MTIDQVRIVTQKYEEYNSSPFNAGSKRNLTRDLDIYVKHWEEKWTYRMVADFYGLSVQRVDQIFRSIRRILYDNNLT